MNTARIFPGYVLDLDGTVYLGDALLPGARHTIETLRGAGARVVFLSNKPLQTRADYAAKLTRLGIPTSPDEVINSSWVLTRWLEREAPGAALFVVGEPPLLAELRAAGFCLTERPGEIAFVVASFDRAFDYRKLQIAFDAVRAGARLVATNADRYCPTPEGGLPDAAAVIGAIEGCTGKQVEVVVGKPSPITARAILDRLQLSPSDCIVVGDRLETDVRMGREAGMATAVVLTGVTTPELLAVSDIQPDYVLSRLDELLSASHLNFWNNLYHNDKRRAMNEKIENLIAQMTLEEKVSMLAGADLWHTVPVERLGIPAIRVTDGPNGARGSQARGGPSSVCFPVGIALAATWNPELVERVGMALGEETKAKGAHILLAPTVNIHRSTLNGRNFECYSEDPYLSGRIATAYVNGLQSQEVGACIKHFVCNDSEFERFTTSSEVSERALREIYLTPFRMAVRDAKPWAVMSAYNKINGTWASENPYTLLDILKGEWEFDGIVISDWFGSNSVDVANGGLDLEMPGPARWLGDKVLEAAKAGAVSEEVIDDKVRRLLRTIIRAGAFEQPELRPEQAIDKPEHRRLVREAAGEAIVLLKNTNDVLPLNVENLDSLAIIGPNAKAAQVQGGGSAHVTPHYVVAPYDGILNKIGDTVETGYEIGCTIHKMSPLIDVNWLTTDDASRNGLTAEYFDNRDLSGDPVHTKVTDSTELVWFGDAMPHADLSPKEFSVRLTGTFTPPKTGTYTFGLTGVGLNRLFIDDAEIITNWMVLGRRGEESIAEVEMTAGQSYRLKVEYGWEGEIGWRMLRLGCMPPVSPDSINDAVALAARSDVALVFAGLTDEWESEGYDRSDMELAGDQVELIEKVAAANPNTVVVLNTGSPITMHWLDKVAAVVQAWYPGQEAGNGIADVLFGDVNPSGKLPQTFPKRIQDNPAYINYPGENGKVHYGEGIFVGYRYYDKKDIEPLFPFGYGLSYTTFAYKNLALNADEYISGDEVQVSVDVENTGPRAGKEIVQLYVRDTESSLARPEKELKAFAKVTLEPGETKTVTFALDQDALSFYDPAKKQWVAEPGEFQVLVGSSSHDIHLTECFVLKKDPAIVPSEAARLHVGLSMKELLEDETARAVLEKHIPEVMASPQLAMAMGMSLEQIAGFVPQILTPEKLEEINDDLATASA